MIQALSPVKFSAVVTFNNNPKDPKRDAVEDFQPHVFYAYCKLKKAGVTDALIPIEYGPPDQVAQQRVLTNGEQGIMAAAICIAANKMVSQGHEAGKVAQTVSQKLSQLLKTSLPPSVYPYLGSAYPRNIFYGQVYTHSGESKDIESFFDVK